jgi:hypothetical protein
VTPSDVIATNHDIRAGNSDARRADRGRAGVSWQFGSEPNGVQFVGGQHF